MVPLASLAQGLIASDLTTASIGDGERIQVLKVKKGQAVNEIVVIEVGKRERETRAVQIRQINSSSLARILVCIIRRGLSGRRDSSISLLFVVCGDNRDLQDVLPVSSLTCAAEECSIAGLHVGGVLPSVMSFTFGGKTIVDSKKELQEVGALAAIRYHALMRDDDDGSLLLHKLTTPAQNAKTQ